MVYLLRSSHLGLSIFLAAHKEDIIRGAVLELLLKGVVLLLSTPEQNASRGKSDLLPSWVSAALEWGWRCLLFYLEPWGHGTPGPRYVPPSAISRQKPQAAPPDSTQEIGFCSNQEEIQVPNMGRLLLLCFLKCDKWMNSFSVETDIFLASFNWILNQ